MGAHHHAGVLVLGLPLADGRGRGGGLAVDARGNAAVAVAVVVVMVVVAVAVVVPGAAISARPPVLSQVRVAALLRSAPVSLGVLETPRKIDHEAGGSGAAGPAVGFPFGPAVFPEGCYRWREDGVFLEAARSGPHL